MTKHPFDLTGQVAIVTGSSRGIGRSAAEIMAQMGAKVVVSSRKADACEEVAKGIRDKGGEAIVVPCNISRKSDVEALVKRTLDTWGRIDTLVCNAAVNPVYGPMSQLPDEAFDKVMGSNVKSNIWLANLVAPHMAAQGGGAIVNISSIAGVRHLGHDLAAYAASKAALQQYSKVASVRYAPDNVRINTVIPGLMFTPLVTARLAGQQAGGDAAALIAKRHSKPPMNRMGDAWDVAFAALYLASDEAKYVTGAEIMVDGGLSNTVR